ncbi:MAG: sulfatase-like hydrolase/transferase [Planctomycetes bacterium]|nr:sulfatase-like hydrolase/transferase [Planctomycetota bacterium]
MTMLNESLRKTFSAERALHIAVLCAFAFSQPLYAVLTQQFVYLHDLDAGLVEVGFVVLLLTILLPLAWIALDLLTMCVAMHWNRQFRNLVPTILLTLAWLSILRPFIGFQFLTFQSIVWIASLALAIPAAVLCMLLYERTTWIRSWVSVAAVSLVCFPGMFLYQFFSLSRPRVATPEHSQHPVPVIMIVFDEFSGLSLMNRDLQIDAGHFPQFDRLGKLSTWYRQASTVHIRTDVAVPAILSGQFPTVPRPPLESEYPGNLFQIIHGTDDFDMTVFEPVTRLCPKSLQTRERSRRSTQEKIRSLVATLLAVYPRLVLPNDTPLEFPPISRLWFGLPEQIDWHPSVYIGLQRFDPFIQRREQAQNFIQSLRNTEKPLFNFLHIEIPHIPSCLLPSGHEYNYDEMATFHPAGAWGDIGENWANDPGIVARNEHRYLLQLQFVDRFIGQLLDRLQEIDELDRCLLIVTADHGVSYRPGHSRRIPDAETLPDLLSIPLFVKLPGQAQGEISDSNVESVDLLPTIAEVLGMPLAGPVDGVSVLSRDRRPRKTLYHKEGMTTKEGLTVLEPSIPRMTAAVDRRWQIFGAGSWERPPEMACSHPDWRGRPTSAFEIEDAPLNSLNLMAQYRLPDASNLDYRPCLVAGSMDAGDLGITTADLVLVVDGIVQDSQFSFHKSRNQQGFEFLLPESVVKLPGQVELFHADRLTDPRPRLRRLGKWPLFDVR